MYPLKSIGDIKGKLKNRAAAVFRIAAIVFLGGVAQTGVAGSVNIAPTPILTATLPTNSTYQVEFSTTGGSWVPTGVLIAGSGTPNTVRLDGVSFGRPFRLSRIGDGNSVTPAVAKGVHLTASFQGASEVHIQSINQLGSLPSLPWSHHAYASPNFRGGFVFALRPPLQTSSFFRAVQPASPLGLATVTYYFADPGNNASGFSLVADDMPQLYRDGHIAAPCPSFYHRNGANAAAVGECYELAGPQGKTTVMIADISDGSTSGTCEVGRDFFDLGFPAFTNLVKVTDGIGTATYRLVPAPVTGNVKMVCVLNSGGYYVELRPYNYRAGISKLEVQFSGGPWIELSRTSYNSFVYSSSPPLDVTFNTRVTSRFGEVVTFPAISSMTNGSRFTANAQFNIFPDQGPSPVWTAPAIFLDEFTNIRGSQWGASSYGGASFNPSYAGNYYAGNSSLQISDMSGFSGVTIHSTLRFPRRTDGFLEFAIRSEGAAINGLKLQFEGADNADTAAQSSEVSLPTIDSSWRVLQIPLDPASVPAQIRQVRLFNSTGATLAPVLLDSVAFRWP